MDDKYIKFNRSAISFDAIEWLCCKSADGQAAASAGQTFLATFVTGMGVVAQG
jgi:hypothetical protein